MQGDEHRPTNRVTIPVDAYDGDKMRHKRDSVVTEEPLEVRIRVANESRRVAVTMRTPGSDFELAAGFLLAEGVVRSREQILGISYCKDDDLPDEQLFNIVIVQTAPDASRNLESLERHFHVSSACGVCGKTSLDAIELRGVAPVMSDPRVEPGVVAALPERLRSTQKLFDKTGGLHAAGLFTASGEVVAVREDVGRHNAVDKVLGWALLEDRVPLDDHILMVSGRSSFEIAQKAVAAGVPVVGSVSAPSSLAIEVARRFGVTLLGFVRDGRFNVYAGAERISPGVLKS